MFCLSWHAIFMIVVTVFATFLCSPLIFNLRFQTSIAIFSYGTITPLTFGIGASFAGRDDTVASLGKLKALVISLYMTMNFWDETEDKRFGKELLPILEEMLRCMEIVCRNQPEGLNLDGSGMDPGTCEADERVYDAVAEIAQVIESRGADIGLENARGAEAGIGRAWECVRKILQEWEGIKHSRFYPSPQGLRNFCFFLSHLAPVALAPFWLSFCAKESKGLDLEVHDDPVYGCVSAYFVGIIFTIVVVTLHEVRDGLDNPFNQGVDGVQWERWHNQLSCISKLHPDGPELRAAARAIR